MNKKQRIALSACLFAVALMLAVYGAGFSWPRVLVVALAVFIWKAGEETWKAAFAKPAFNRIQFRIGLEYLSSALETAGPYVDELPQAAEAICEAMPGRGWVIFTWLEPELFYMKASNTFSSTPELTIALLDFGSRRAERSFERPDVIEMRGGAYGYELVLLTREQRYSRPGAGNGTVLFSLPYRVFRALQGPGDIWERHKEAKRILAGVPGLEYQEIAEVPDGWDYRNQYGSFDGVIYEALGSRADRAFWFAGYRRRGCGSVFYVHLSSTDCEAERMATMNGRMGRLCAIFGFAVRAA